MFMFPLKNLARKGLIPPLLYLQDLFPTMKQVYGVDIKPLSKHNTTIYKRWGNGRDPQ